MTGISSIFTSYVPCSDRDKVRIADSSFTPIIGKGAIKCSSSFSLSSVLHVPSFPANLLSISSITKDLNCKVTFFLSHCVLQKLAMEEIIGVSKMCNGLYLLDNFEPCSKQTGLMQSNSSKVVAREVLLHHRRLGHLSSIALSKLFPNLSYACKKLDLSCDACEFAKLTRSTYVFSGTKSEKLFDVIHSDVWGPCSTTFLFGHKWFVTFIDCFSRTTWVYLLKHKNEVFQSFLSCLEW
ncbi:Retrovirus-related Pol polyprotein from transposon TNT 1-94 [Apostasia shenzhenica]|uniref:Retrovirus-related Pol polyprotein from transposon TNT 1-94 n=1 Tax=Apostasia shenzhenica TaxID=1088818 RepID=A0A2I0AEF9_9ASPA|nr:Retrovirus-related Pol polyprotein from transposon TNT 1-94 [Apostasia shenzhenica]